MNGFSTPWTSMWVFRAQVPVNPSPHLSHLGQDRNKEDLVLEMHQYGFMLPCDVKFEKTDKISMESGVSHQNDCRLQ